MCGIVAYSGFGDAARLLLQGLKKLEYRGYDSSGLTLEFNYVERLSLILCPN